MSFIVEFLFMQKRPFDDENYENCRSSKRSKIADETNKENDLVISCSSIVKRSRHGIGVCLQLKIKLLFFFLYSVHYLVSSYLN